jgi:hypothetical protein
MRMLMDITSPREPYNTAVRKETVGDSWPSIRKSRRWRSPGFRTSMRSIRSVAGGAWNTMELITLDRTCSHLEAT